MAPGEAERGGALRREMWRSLPAALAAVVVAMVAIYVLPGRSRNPLWETTAWSMLVLTSFGGWGSLVARVVAPREHVDVGLRTVWGAAALCAIGGLLATLAWMSRGTAFLLVEAGLVLGIAALLLDRAAVAVRTRSVLRRLVRAPRLTLVGAALAGLVAIHFLAGVAEVQHHPYDDDIAYLAFLRKLLDTGTLLEPFSLRRLSALGGQTFFLELVAVRAGPYQANTFDRSISLLLVVLLLLGHRARSRRLPWLVAVSSVALVTLLPSAATNTASYGSGVAFFLGLYRTMDWSGRRERAPWRNAVAIALVGAAICTLRQNYVLVAATTLAMMYASRLLSSRREWRSRIAEPLLAAAFSVLYLVPWGIVAWQSNRTFLYPVMLGTANPAMQFQSGSTPPLGELHLQLWTFLEGIPLKTAALFVIAAAMTREPDARRPLGSMLLGTLVGFIVLVHGLTQGEPGNIGRYAFGFIMALALAAVLGTSSRRFEGPLGRGHAAAGVAMLGVVLALVESRADLYRFYGRATRNVGQLANVEPRSPATDPPEVALYQRMQGAVPTGDRIAVMLDEPYHLDFRRNPIWNFDMPGYSSLPPGMPYFMGSERVEAYLRALGVRYVAYVRDGFSRYQYRREYWVQMIVDEQEVWRAHAPYVIDFVDNLAAIDARHRRVFEERGLVVIDLEAPR